MNNRIYMDWNATAKLSQATRLAMLEVWEEAGNPSSVHKEGRKAREHIEKARRKLADFIHAKPENIIFTSGGTEANNLAIHAASSNPIFVSAIEHDSVLKPASRAKAMHIAVDQEGIVNLSDLEQKLKSAAQPAFVSVMLANNETGVIQPIAEVAKIVHLHNGLLHCDASQALNRIEVNLEQLGADMLTLSAHKAGGPLGVGALILRTDRVITPNMVGGGQEKSRRAGTENLPAIVGFAACLDQVDFQRTEMLRDLLEDQLTSMDPAIQIFGKSVKRLPNTTCLASGHKKSDALIIGFDLAGISISAGSACSSGKVKSSHVIEAMGYNNEVASRSIRISLGLDNTKEEIERFTEVWRDLHPIHLQAQDGTSGNLSVRNR